VGTFFIPGTGTDRDLAERAYADMRARLELELGARPTARRISKLWTRRGSTDCVTEVGVPDPLRGGVVLAIFDMGHLRPFVIWWQPPGGGPMGVREVLTHHSYSVVEFDS
jgi:hypothetical protein